MTENIAAESKTEHVSHSQNHPETALLSIVGGGGGGTGGWRELVSHFTPPPLAVRWSCFVPVAWEIPLPDQPLFHLLPRPSVTCSPLLLPASPPPLYPTKHLVHTSRESDHRGEAATKTVVKK